MENLWDLQRTTIKDGNVWTSGKHSSSEKEDACTCYIRLERPSGWWTTTTSGSDSSSDSSDMYSILSCFQRGSSAWRTTNSYTIVKLLFVIISGTLLSLPSFSLLCTSFLFLFATVFLSDCHHPPLSTDISNSHICAELPLAENIKEYDFTCTITVRNSVHHIPFTCFCVYLLFSTPITIFAFTPELNGDS